MHLSKETKEFEEGPFRGENCELNLLGPDGYDMIIEVVPAWHDDVIGHTSAVGLKFHLMVREPSDTTSCPISDPTPDDGSVIPSAANHAVSLSPPVSGSSDADPKKRPAKPKFKRACLLGYTGDTGAYGIKLATPDRCPKTETDNEPENPKNIGEQYFDCDILVAHLGDIRIRELMSVISLPKQDPAAGGADQKDDPLLRLLRDSFEEFRAKCCSPGFLTSDVVLRFQDSVREFLAFALALQMIPEDAQQTMLPSRTTGQKISIMAWLQEFIDQINGKLASFEPLDYDFLTMPLPNADDRMEHALIDAKSIMKKISQFRKCADVISDPVKYNFNILLVCGQVYFLLEYLCISYLSPWQYKYHLGIFGIYKLYWRLKEAASQARPRLFVIGELPEELVYRDMVAALLNEMNLKNNKKPIHASTGDIGLHIGLKSETGGDAQVRPKIRCTFCNYNNETILQKEHYHEPEDIREVPLKRMQGAITYLCKVHEPDYNTEFLIRPEMRLV